MMRRNATTGAGSDQRTIVYRVGDGEATGRRVPLLVRSAGRHEVSGGYREEHAEARWFTQLFWTVEGAVTFWAGGSRHRAGAGDVFVYRPEERHVFEVGVGGWCSRWMTLDGRDTGAVLRMFGLERAGRAGRCPEEWFNEVEAGLKRVTREGVRAASVAAYAILEAATRREAGRGVAAADGGLADQVRRALDDDFRRPDVGVETVAHALGRHRTTVLRTFLSVYGVTPSTYLARRRLQHALSLLRTTTLPVAEVATEAGFRSPEYLARVVRVETGRSPREFRELGRETQRSRRK